MVESLDLMLEIDLKEENKKKKKLGGGGFKPAIDQGKGKQIEGQGKESKPGGGCFICGRLHYTREYLKKEIFNVIWLMTVNGKKQSHTSTRLMC